MKKWYQSFEWSKVTEPAFRWLAIGMVAILAPSAVSLSSSADTTITQTAKSSPSEPVFDSLRECIKKTNTELQELKTLLREKQLNDSNNRVNLQQQISYTREDVADIKRILMSRAFAYAR